MAQFSITRIRRPGQDERAGMSMLGTMFNQGLKGPASMGLPCQTLRTAAALLSQTRADSLPKGKLVQSHGARSALRREHNAAAGCRCGQGGRCSPMATGMQSALQLGTLGSLIQRRPQDRLVLSAPQVQRLQDLHAHLARPAGGDGQRQRQCLTTPAATKNSPASPSSSVRWRRVWCLARHHGSIKPHPFR